MDALGLIREQVALCESQGISILCCPEAILGGLADLSDEPSRLAIRTADGELDRTLAPLRSTTVTTIIGFTELASDGNLYNSAAVLHCGVVAGVYRKRHPARRRSVYAAGSASTVFEAGALKFAIIICNDSNYVQPAKAMTGQGAAVLFVPSNNALPSERTSAGIVRETRTVDVTRAVENRAWVIRADVAGQHGELAAHGTSAVVNPTGQVVTEAGGNSPELLVVDLPF
jgi:predicted amidohydrolase